MKGLYWKVTIIKQFRMYPNLFIQSGQLPFQTLHLLVCVQYVPSGPDGIPSSVGCSMTHPQCHILQHHGSHEHLTHTDSGGAFEVERSHQESSKNILCCIKEIQYCTSELSYQCIPPSHTWLSLPRQHRTRRQIMLDWPLLVVQLIHLLALFTLCVYSLFIHRSVSLVFIYTG